ncbi:uncharacterized protein [Palaemon carinicauda]|uniref:uncharacterized protein n=1 Tax=Palaemon carinicauda TaxID=392227 RepID=UPI0035B57FE1
MAEYDFTLQHIPGKMNTVVDTLLRNTLATIGLGLDHNVFAEAQRKDLEYQACRTSFTSFYWENIALDSSNTILLYDRCFAHIYIDVVHPLPTSQGHRYPFTLFDPSTRWPEAIPIGTATSTSCTSALLSGCIVSFGIHEHITFNRGTTFTSQLWT